MIATAQLRPANSISWSTEKAYSVNNSLSTCWASTWLDKQYKYEISKYLQSLTHNQLTAWYKSALAHVTSNQHDEIKLTRGIAK